MFNLNSDISYLHIFTMTRFTDIIFKQKNSNNKHRCTHRFVIFYSIKCLSLHHFSIESIQHVYQVLRAHERLLITVFLAEIDLFTKKFNDLLVSVCVSGSFSEVISVK